MMSYILARLIWQVDMRRLDPVYGNVGEDTVGGAQGRTMKNEFQLYYNFASRVNGPVVQFMLSTDMVSIRI
ncbi:hypothetical protein F4808DRAFT_420324 [Astrocystis sublimbata]|nr:hypothetical protein F4808DRAFT_420324 [Astrocystis sublimbata]